MHRLRSGFLAFCFIILCSTQPAVSASDKDAVVESPEVIVSATKTPLPVSQVTSAVEVIRGEDMQRRNIKTVVDALRLATGVSVFSSGGPGRLAQVQMRGTKSAHTMILIDGVILNSPTTGIFDFSSLVIDNIDRIEILRGAQSMLYGSDAIGGVINIITKRGAGDPTSTVFAEYGSFATFREGGNLSGAKGPFDFAMTLSRWDSSSFSAANYRRGANERDGFHNWQASGRFGLQLPKDGRLEFSLRWWNTDSNFDSTNADVFGSKSTNRDLYLSALYEQQIINSWSQKLTLAQGNERLISVGGPVQKNLSTGVVGAAFPFLSDIETLNRRIEWQHNVQVSKELLLTGGYQYREEQADATSSFSATTPIRLLSTHAGYAQAQANIKDRFLMTAGVRQDNYNVFGDATTYRVTGGYRIPETGTKLRGSYATGFRAPTLNDLFFQNFGNETLRPEKAQSLDVGVDQTFLNDALKFSVGYFWTRSRNLIQFVSSATCPPSTAPFGVCPINVQLAKSQGWESSVDYSISKSVAVRGQYTYTLTRNLQNGARLARYPVHQASASLLYRPIDPLSVTVDYRYSGTRFNDQANTTKMGTFGVVNVSANYQLTNRIEVYTRIENLTDQDYEETASFGTPIRSVYGGVKFQLF